MEPAEVEPQMKIPTQMAMSFAAMLLMGCVGATPQQSLEGVDLSKKNQKCVQGCSTTYSACIQYAGTGTTNRLVANDVIRACGGALRICVDTCGPQ